MSTERRRKFWGWGYEGEGPTPEQQGKIAEVLAARFGIDVPALTPAPRVEELRLRAPRVTPPAAFAEICSASPIDRAGHTYGKSFRDVVAAARQPVKAHFGMKQAGRAQRDVAAADQ